MKSILIPTDFSACAREAVRVALVVALKSEAQLYFLHMFPDRTGVMHVPQLSSVDKHPQPDPEEGHAKNNLAKLVLLAEKLNLKATPVLVYNKGNEKIADYIKAYHIDLVVMGSQGASGIKEFIVGSNAQYVVRHSPVPVIIVKKVPGNLDIKDIVFPSRFQIDTHSALGSVVEIGKLLQARIRLLYINLDTSLVREEEAREKMNEVNSKFPDIIFSSGVINTNDEEWGINQFVQMYPCDMIAISRNEYKAGIGIFSRNLAELLANHEIISVLAV